MDEETEAFERHVQAYDRKPVLDNSLPYPQVLSPSDVDSVCETYEPTVAHQMWDLQSHRQRFEDA